MDTTYPAKQVATMISVPYRTLMFWVEEGLLHPSWNTNSQKRSKVRFTPKDVREASILAGLRANRLSLQQLRNSLSYLRSVGHNPLSTGDFLIIRGRDGKPADLLKFCSSGEVMDLMRGRYGQLVMPLWSPPESEVETEPQTL